MKHRRPASPKGSISCLVNSHLKSLLQMYRDGTQLFPGGGIQMRSGCFSTSVKTNLTCCGSLPAQGMSRTLLANANGPSPQRSRRYPYGFPWLPQQGKGATDSVTINAAALLVLALAAVTQKNTALVLPTSEERGEAHFGEPCSWWQTAEVKHLAELGAIRGALYTCELAHKWSQGTVDKPGSMGFMAQKQ